MARLGVLGKLRLELGDPRAQDEALLVAHLANGVLDLRAQRGVLTFEVE
jgi:hypothetical protein